MLHADIEVRDSVIEGKGLVAKRFIPKGTVVWTEDDNKIDYTAEEMLKLSDDIRKYIYQTGPDRYTLLKDGSQYMNHSCEPNTDAVDSVGTFMVAVRDIHPGEEVTYEYGTCDIDERLRSHWECRCGSANCRKTISHDDCLNPEFQKRYEGHLSEWVLDYIRTHQPVPEM